MSQSVNETSTSKTRCLSIMLTFVNVSAVAKPKRSGREMFPSGYASSQRVCTPSNQSHQHQTLNQLIAYDRRSTSSILLLEIFVTFASPSLEKNAKVVIEIFIKELSVGRAAGRGRLEAGGWRLEESTRLCADQRHDIQQPTSHLRLVWYAPCRYN
jgi:hypothetical protein